MSPRHHFKNMVGPYFGSDHYQETHEAAVERAIEAKWEAFKAFVKRPFKRLIKR